MTEDTTDELMRATYCALCKHGYAALTMQDIADESEKSKASLHYHYDTKRDLLLAFLDYLYEQFEARVETVEGDDAAERLLSLAERVLDPPTRRKNAEFKTALLEIHAQAPYRDGYRERLRRFDDLLEARLTEIVADGVDEGTFRADVDPPTAAAFLTTVLSGAQTRHVAVGYPISETQGMLRRYVESHLVADEDGRVVG